MKIKICCEDMSLAIESYKYIKRSVGGTIRMHGVVIEYCPFCGKKIEIYNDSKDIIVKLSQVGLEGHGTFRTEDNTLTFGYVASCLGYKFDKQARFCDKYGKKIYKANNKIKSGHYIIAPV